jgi:hypothetical protein
MEIPMIRKFVLITLLAFLLAGCAPKPEPSSSITSEQTNATCGIQNTINDQPALYGMWASDDRNTILTVTEKSVYLVEIDTNTRETYYEIQSVDWATDVVTMVAKWVRVNGKFGGFDAPLRYLKVSIDNDNLKYSLGDEGQGIPLEATSGPLIRK